MLEAFKSLRGELSSKKQAEVVQTSASASKPGTRVDNLDQLHPRPTNNPPTEDMDVDYDPALPPGLGSDRQNFSDQNFNTSKVPTKKPSDRPKNTLTLIGSMITIQDPTWTNTLTNPTNLGCHVPNPKNMLTRANINLDMFHLPCFPLAQLSRMPLISLSMTSRLLIYLKVNISNHLPLQGGTRWDNPEENTGVEYRFLKNLYYSKALWGPNGRGSPIDS